MSLPWFLESEGYPTSRNSRDVGLFFTSLSTYTNLPLSSAGSSSQNPALPRKKPGPTDQRQRHLYGVSQRRPSRWHQQEGLSP